MEKVACVHLAGDPEKDWEIITPCVTRAAFADDRPLLAHTVAAYDPSSLLSRRHPS